jgi:hypothetical protein
VRATQLPDNFALEDQTYNWALERSGSAEMITASLARFRDHHRQVPGNLFAGTRCVFKNAALMGGDMISLVAFDFVLRIVFRGVMHMTLVVEVRGE